MSSPTRRFFDSRVYNQLAPPNTTIVPLPKEWPKYIRTAVINVISLARLALMAARGQAAPQMWPFCWWIACVVDQYSRRVVDFRVFAKEPRSLDMRNLLGRTITEVGTTPRYVVSDKGRQFDARAFRLWCKRHGIRPRYAAAATLRATAIVERFFRSLKEEWLHRIMVPLRRDQMEDDLASYFRWFEASRPHQGLGGRTPREVYETLPIARPPVIDRDRPFELLVHFQDGLRQLPIVELKQVA